MGLITFLSCAILVFCGCTVDTTAQDMGHAVDVVTEISPPSGRWHVTVVESVKILDVRQRSFSVSAVQNGSSWMIDVMFSWGNTSHYWNIAITIPEEKTEPVELPITNIAVGSWR